MSSIAQSVLQVFQTRKLWTVETIYMSVIDNPESPKNEWTVSALNIANYVGKKNLPREQEWKKIFFANLAEVNDRKHRHDSVVPAFKAACRRAGFVAASNGYNAKKRTVRIVCNGAKQYDPYPRGRRNDGGGVDSNGVPTGLDGGSDTDGANTDEAPGGVDTDATPAASDQGPQGGTRARRTNHPKTKEEKCSFQFSFQSTGMRQVNYGTSGQTMLGV
jgi:hypothetical protein